MISNTTDLRDHQAVSHQDGSRRARIFLPKKKEFTRLRDELSRKRREVGTVAFWGSLRHPSPQPR